MKIYFSAPVSRVTHEIRQNYEFIINCLRDLGHNVLAEHIKGKTADKIKKQTREQALQVQKLMTKRKKQADLVVLEVSTPSFGIGQELASALDNNKQVVALYASGHEPHLLRDENQDSLFVVEYSKVNLKQVLREVLEDARDQMDVRFNFFISPKIGAYLDWIAKHRKLPRAVFLRKLIEEHMAKNKDYKG